MTAGGRGGGPATAIGTDFQARIAASFACAILGEAAVPPTWGWSESAVVESVYAETGEAIDDLLVKNSEGCRAYMQAKHRVQLDKGAKSPLAKTLNQFVLQYISGKESLHDCDRYILATSSESSVPIRSLLPTILSRMKALPAGEDLMNAAKNKAELDTLKVVVDHIKEAWKNKKNATPDVSDIRRILEAMRVSIFDLYEDQPNLREAQSILRTTVLQDTGAAGSVWGQLVSLAAQFSIMQTGANRQWLQESLTSAGVGLRAAVSYRSDIDKLIAYSQRTIDRLADFASIRGDDGNLLTLKRAASDELHRALSDGSIIVTGDPGAGKSACIFEVANTLKDGQFIALSADALPSGSLGSLRDELALDHDFIEVLQNWPTCETGPYLIVDALDAARGEGTQKTLLEVIRLTRKLAGNWTVLASVRRFDLRYNPELKNLFSSNEYVPPTNFQLDEFRNIRHFNVPILIDTEVDQLRKLSPDLYALVTDGTDELRDLVHVPFNLRLLAELMSLHVKPIELQPIVTQIELLDKYWEHRVLSPQPGDSRESLLRAACTDMLNTKSMQISRARLHRGAGFAAESIEELLSNRVIVEQEGTGSIERERISFSHHVLFDYAVARLLLRGVESDIVSTTVEQRSLLLIARPSYAMQFRHLWESNADRRAFWSLALTLAAADELPEIGKIIGPAIAASGVQVESDVQPLMEQLDAQRDHRRAAELVLRHLVGARLGGEALGEQIPPDRRGIWCKIVGSLGQSVRAETLYAVANLLKELSRNAAQLDDEPLRDLGVGARSLMKWAHDSGNTNRHLLQIATAAVVSTFSTDPEGAEKLIRNVLATERLNQFGYLDIPVLADVIAGLSGSQPELVRDIYSTAFEFVEESEDATALSSGVVGLTSNKRQDYAHAHYVLAEFFPTFLEQSPRDAIEALAATLRAYHKNGRTYLSDAFDIDWLGKKVVVEPDASCVWDVDDLYANDEQVKMLSAFTDWLTLQARSGGATAVNPIIDYLRNTVCPASIWRRVLIVAAQFPEEFKYALEPMCSRTTVLASNDLSDVIDRYLCAAFPLLTEDSRQRIETAIVELPGTAS